MKDAKSSMPAHDNTTGEYHRRAVERVILAMRENLSENLSLREMSSIAYISRFHFNRVFRQITGIPPVQFLYALRLEAAKRMLLTTSLSVTEICFEVGYNSLGTFTRRFTELVGLSPRRFRWLAETFDPSQALPDNDGEASYQLCHQSQCLKGRVAAPDGFEGLIFVGLFTSPIPQGRPARCALLTKPGAYHIDYLADRSYYLFAAALPRSIDPIEHLLQGAALHGAAAQGPIIARGGQAGDQTDINLQVIQLTDPPLLVALPLLLQQFSNKAAVPKSVATIGQSRRRGTGTFTVLS